MLYDHFKVSDTDESVVDFNEILKVELKNYNIQSFNTRWDETMIVMKKQPDEEMLFFHAVSFNSQSSGSHRCLCTLKILFRKVIREITPDLKRCWPDTQNRKFLCRISPHEGQLGKPESGVAAAKGKNQGTGKRNSAGLRAVHNKSSLLSRR